MIKLHWEEWTRIRLLVHLAICNLKDKTIILMWFSILSVSSLKNKQKSQTSRMEETSWPVQRLWIWWWWPLIFHLLVIFSSTLPLLKWTGQCSRIKRTLKLHPQLWWITRITSKGRTFLKDSLKKKILSIFLQICFQFHQMSTAPNLKWTTTQCKHSQWR